MTKGGYQILDLSGLTLAEGTSAYKENMYETIESTRKAILVSGLEFDGVEYRDFFCYFTVQNSNFVGAVELSNDVKFNITIGQTLDNLDSITITNLNR